jgi:hypothetical protein
VFLVNSRYPLACATPSSSESKSLHPNGVLLLPKLRRQFAEFLNHGSPDLLGILYLSTCVGLGYGHHANLPLGFSWQHRISDFALIGSASRLRLDGPSLNDPPYTLTPGQPLPGFTYLPASPFGYPRKARTNRPKSASSSPTLGWARTWWYWNINQLCIDYAFRPRLSSRLTLGGLALPRNPWTSGGGVSHPSFATHACILTRCHSTTGSPAASTLHRRSATTRPKTGPQLRLWT